MPIDLEPAFLISIHVRKFQNVQWKKMQDFKGFKIEFRFYKALLLFLGMFSSLFAAEEEILVHVSSKEALAPLYLHMYGKENAGFDSRYIKELKEALLFDFDNNGKTRIIISKEAAALAEKEELRAFDIPKWKAAGIDYIVKFAIVEKQLVGSIFSRSSGALKVFDPVELTGDLSVDRKKAHKVSDKIHETLFKQKGIAETRILYTVRTKSTEDTEGKSEIWTADYDGKNARQVSREGCLCVTPAFVPTKPNSRCLNYLYVSYKIGQPKIYAAAIDLPQPKRLSYLKGNQLMPAISPTLDKVSFISDVTGNPDLFIQDFSLKEGLKGKPRQIFSAPFATQGSPSFSPDGRKIAFVSNKDGTARIYIMEVPPLEASIKDLKPLLISKQNRDNTSPAWSPDGKKIAYSSSTRGTRQIWIYDFETKQEKQLTEGPGHKENPAWAPNSLHLLFNSSAQGASDLFLINLNQKKAVKITHGAGEKRFPVWETYSKIL